VIFGSGRRGVFRSNANKAYGQSAQYAMTLPLTVDADAATATVADGATISHLDPPPSYTDW
jgi:hypothetical protein